MDFKYQKIIDLVNTSLDNKTFNQPISLDEYKLIRDNQLSGLIYNSLNKDLISEEVYRSFKSDYYQYIRQDEIQKQLIEELRVLFNLNHIDFVFLKGTFLKTIYPESYMRAMGDIDILVKEKSMNDIHALLDANGFKNWSNSAAHDCFMKQKINIEIHPQLDSNIEGEYKDLFSDPWRYTTIYKENEYWLNHEYNFFYQVYHMIKHLYKSGVGYRTFVDLFVYLNRFEKDMNKEEFSRIYNMFPKKKYIDYLLTTINNIFTIFNLNFNFNLLKDYLISDNIFLKYKDIYLEYVITSGTHGIGESHNLFVGDMAKKNNKRRFVVFTKIQFLFSRTFLGFKQMKGIYRYLHKFPFLLPVAWIQRFFKLLLSRRARQKLKRLHINKEEVVKVEELFDYIGI